MSSALFRFRVLLPGFCGKVLAACLLAAVAGGCANIQHNSDLQGEIIEENDPLEVVNRQIFAANLAIDTFLLRPAAVAYRELMPAPGKTVIRNFINNLKLPFTFINDVAQGEMARAQTAFNRFLVNTVLGVGGLFDPATDLGLEYHKEDFGQTLAVYGIDDGPYLVLPLLGPSSFRDAIGTAVGFVADPVRVGADAADLEDAVTATTATDAVDARYRNLGTVDSLRQRSLDFYATVRSLYRQRRANEVRNGNPDTAEGAVVLSQEAPETVDPAPAGDLASPDAATVVPQNIAALPEVAADRPQEQPAPDIEPAVPSEGSPYADALRAFEEASRAYEKAVRSMEARGSNKAVHIE